VSKYLENPEKTKTEKLLQENNCMINWVGAQRVSCKAARSHPPPEVEHELAGPWFRFLICRILAK